MAAKKMNIDQAWQAEMDAETMARYEEIIANSRRRNAAIKAARTRATDLNRQASAMSKVAGTNNKTRKK